MANTIELVTHCWAKQLDQYGWHLQLQLSSILHYAPLNAVLVTVCYCPQDELTSQILDFFVEKMPHNIKRIALAKTHLFRRAIGRNVAAKDSKADLVWFTDVDYFFGDRCFEALRLMPRHRFANLMRPAQVWRHKDWETGDRLVDSIREGGVGVVDMPNKDDFKMEHEKIAIGGLQIVPGDFARENGYLDGTKWVKPVDASKGFRRCHCDTAFRDAYNLGRRGKETPVPNIFRIRHTKDGRDFDDD